MHYNWSIRVLKWLYVNTVYSDRWERYTWRFTLCATLANSDFRCRISRSGKLYRPCRKRNHQKPCTFFHCLLCLFVIHCTIREFRLTFSFHWPKSSCSLGKESKQRWWRKWRKWTQIWEWRRRWERASWANWTLVEGKTSGSHFFLYRGYFCPSGWPILHANHILRGLLYG